MDNKMDLRTLGILEHWGYRQIKLGVQILDLRTLGVKWILEHWGYR